MNVTRKALREYLEQHKDGQFTRRMYNQCPIAHYVGATNPRATDIVVDSFGIHWHVSNGQQCHRVMLANWQRKFIKTVDAESGTTITGGEALAILDAMEA